MSPPSPYEITRGPITCVSSAVRLIRGVAKIRLVDFDYVTLSSLNRHAAAGLADVGTPKVKCLVSALRRFSRWIEIDPRIELWKKENGGALLEGVDWVIGGVLSSPCSILVLTVAPADAIDNISTKVDLLHYCHSHNIKVGHLDVFLNVAKHQLSRYRSSLPWAPEQNRIHPECRSATSRALSMIHWRDRYEGG